MNTAEYTSVESILFKASGFAGDREYNLIPKGFYISLISDAFREFNFDSFFSIARKDLEIPETLTINLPEDCFNVKEVYVFTGDACVIANSKKVWWKKDYYTRGKGYIAKNKGNNGNDPYYNNTSLSVNSDKSLIRWNNGDNINNLLYYNIQMGNLMLSSSCLSAGAKVHIVYNSTGGPVTEAPIIPSFCKTAIEDYVTEAALRFRMSNEPSMIRVWQPIHQLYERKLDKEGMNGSWFNAIMRVRNLNDAQRFDLGNYYGRGSWAAGR